MQRYDEKGNLLLHKLPTNFQIMQKMKNSGYTL